MPHSSQKAVDPHWPSYAALSAGLLVAVCGLYPHLRWSLELKQVAWFFNSYDEGYYGWLSVSSLSSNRALSDLIMHGLYFAAGSNAQFAMILADSFLPLAVTMACCYMARPLFTSAAGMVAGGLFVMISAECWALRSTSIPHSALLQFLQDKIPSLGAGAADLVQLGNQTSTFWLFRTPEPQVSWIIMFLLLGLALRYVLLPPSRLPQWRWLVAISLLAGTGYLFCALPVGCAFMLFSVLAGKAHRWHSLAVGAGGLTCLVVCLGLSIYAASKSGGESLVFPSHRPVVMISAITGLLAASWAWLRGRAQGQFQPVHLFAIALGLTPLCMANQQVLTGRMIYLLNFENFGFAQISAFALLTAIFCRPSPGLKSPEPPSASWRSGWLSAIGPVLACLLMTGVILRSQILGYANYLSENRLAKSYELTLKSLPITDELIACDDFFQTDILAILLGHRPAYLIARDVTFTKPVARLTGPQTLPGHGSAPRLALYRFLALTGVSPAEFSQRFSAITDPDNSSWQDQFMLGGLLYNYADFWSPLTHGRDTKLAWIKTQKTMIVDDYSRFLREESLGPDPVIFVMRQDKQPPAFLTDRQARPLAPSSLSMPIAMKAYRVEAASVLAPH